MAADISAIGKALGDLQSIVTKIISLAGAAGKLSPWQKAQESLSIIMQAGSLAVDIAASIPEFAAVALDPEAMTEVIAEAIAMVKAIVDAASHAADAPAPAPAHPPAAPAS